MNVTLKRRVWIWAMLPVSGFMFYLLWNAVFQDESGLEAEGSGAPGKPPPTSVHGGPKDQSLASRMRKSREEDARHLKMENFKERWVDIGSGVDRRSERDELARETVETLLCSEELLELSRFLKLEGISVGNMVRLEIGVRRALLEDDSGRARGLLVELADKGVSKPIVEDWCLYAGEGCPLEDFDAFRSALAEVSTLAANMALLGRNNRYVKIDPEDTIASSLDIVDETPLAKIYLPRQMENLPGDADLEKLENMLDEHRGSQEVIASARTQLFRQWAIRDAAAAASYVMSHSERLDAGLLTEIGRVGVGSKPAQDLKWILALPEGAYRDAAAEGVIWKYATERLGECRQFAELISDPERKDRVLFKLDAKEEAAQRGEHEGG